MNKKFLSAILFGALMVSSTGTFVSCKDYDDDIDNLQEQINKLATKEDMTSQIATLQAALTTAAKDASDALAKATAAETAAKAAGDAAAAAKAAADKAVADAKAEAIKAVQAEIETLKKEVEESTDAALKEMAEKVDAATKKVEDIVGKIADMVTSVELVASYSANPTGDELIFSTAIEKENVFSEGITNAITFTKGKQVQTGDKFVVRVSPTNAVLTPDMISLTNSQGQNLNEFLSVQKVEKYNGLLSRAAGNNGLWEVTVALKNYDEKAFSAVTETKVGNDTESILFAVQVNNTLSTAETREVISSYDLTLDWQAYTPQNGLNFFVNEKNVNKIHNRYSASENNTPVEYKELEWKNGVSTTVIGLDKSNTNVKQGDNRQRESVYPAVQGKALTISLSTKDNEVEAPKNIRAIYVTLDSQNAVESAPSEINAWNSYEYTGLNTVVEGTSTEITINGDNIIDDIIGFRVYAVNYDGTLVDPDGKAFYVKLGKEAATWETVNTVVTPSANDATLVDMTKSEAEAVTLSKLSAPYQATWTTDKNDNNQPVFHAYFVDSEGHEIYDTNYMLNAALERVDFSKVVKVYTRPTGVDWKKYEDGKEYNGTLTIKNEDGFVLATLNVTMTKEIPTTLPQGFSIKDKQVIDGIYNCYMIADNWAASQASKGVMPIENLINFGLGQADQYNVTFASSVKDGDKDKDVTVNGAQSIEVVKSYIDNKTEHATKVVYNYGKISSKKNSAGEYENVIVEAATFNTVYCCFYKPEVHTWAWATRENLGLAANANLPYSTNLTYGNNAAAPTTAHIWGTNAIDKLFSTALKDAYGSSLSIESAKLTSDATGKEDYFKVDFTKANVFEAIKTDIGSNPKQDVPSTLTINCKDSYGHDVTITLKMVVKPRI